MPKVIDTHAHLGECCVFGLYSTEEEMIRRMDECGVDATIVQPYPGAKDYVKRHDEIAALCAKYPGRFFGFASLSPHTGRDKYQREVERCVK
jgi:predicted TIM-barrel fold metal-dependent hydrolase